MHSVEFSDKELELVILGLQEREDRMYRESWVYKREGNKVAQMDCLNEMREARKIRQRIEGLAQTL